MVGRGGCFTARMHCPQWRSHVDTAQGELRGEYVAQSGASGHIAVVDKRLALHVGHLANVAEHSGTVGIGHIFAVGIDFDTRPVAKDRMVRGILFRTIIWMEAMGIVGRNHERIGHSAEKMAVVAAQACHNAAQDMFEDGRCRTLLGA